jgi:hypothetical protein
MVAFSIICKRCRVRMNSVATDLDRSPSDCALSTQYRKHLLRAERFPVPGAAMRDCVVVMVRGLFGGWIPGHFRAPRQHLSRLGWSVQIAKTDPGGTIVDNAAKLGQQIDRIISEGRRPIFLAHSKGGIELMLALAQVGTRAARTAGFVGVQVPRSGAPYLEHLFPSVHARAQSSTAPMSSSERLESWLLRALGAGQACAELNAANVQTLVTKLDSVFVGVPALLVATSAQRMSNVLELRSQHLARVFPGQPHDGVFLTQDQIWPQARKLILDGIDHAQPSVGGLGFAHQHFWAALMATMMCHRTSPLC